MTKIIPRHIAIIMDGNGRWAKQRGLPRIKGHEKGADAVRECVEGCGELKVEYLTLYAFSAENWQRPKSEVFALMRSEEHTSELQSPCNLVCRLLLDKKKKTKRIIHHMSAHRR